MSDLRLYTIWANADRSEYTFVAGDTPPVGDTPGLRCVYIIRAPDHDEAMRLYHEWQGWEPYKPLPPA